MILERHVKNNIKDRFHTKYEVIQAFIKQVLIDEHSFILMNTASNKLNKVPVLKSCDQTGFIFKLFMS